MKNTASAAFLQSKLLDEKIILLGDAIVLFKNDFRALMEQYMTLSGAIDVAADIDESTGDVLLSITVRASEIYECGNILKA